MALWNHSPLFSPRPHVEGVGRQAPCSNLFTAFIKLSSKTLLHINTNIELLTGQTDVLDLTQDGFDVDKDQLNQCTGTTDNSTFTETDTESTTSSVNQEITEACANNYSKDASVQNATNQYLKEPSHPTHVVDRDRHGTETLISYIFNKNTLRMFDIFHSLKIPFETELYKPKEERLCVDPSVLYCKNILIKDRKGQIYLTICHEETSMDLKYLKKALKAHRNFNFVGRDEMKFLLDTDPGGVTPLALMFANAIDVSMVISRTLYQEGASLMFHPLDSEIATKISMPSLLRFLKFVGHSVIIVD